MQDAWQYIGKIPGYVWNTLLGKVASLITIGLFLYVLITKIRSGSLGAYGLRKGIRKLINIVRIIRHYVKQYATRVERLTIPEARDLITNTAFNHVEMTQEELARELVEMCKFGHYEFGDEYCCEIYFDIGHFSSVKKSTIRQKLEVELTDEYRGRNIHKIFYLKRGPWSGLLANVGNNIGCQVIPIDERQRLDRKWSSPGEHILIVDLLAKGDDCLRNIVDHFTNIRANIVDVVCLFNICNPSIPITQTPVTRSLTDLNLKVTPREGCLCCSRHIFREDYY